MEWIIGDLPSFDDSFRSITDRHVSKRRVKRGRRSLVSVLSPRLKKVTPPFRFKPRLHKENERFILV
jgi:hypothetical protein